MKKYVLLFLILLILPLPAKANEQKGIDVFFDKEAPQRFFHELKNANNSIDCAFVYLKEKSFENLLKEKGKTIQVRITTNDDKKQANNYGLMHNKFCVIDKKIVVTGSFNPDKKNCNSRNNVIVIKNEAVAAFYEDKFEELYFGTKGKLKTKKQGDIEILFCPEDNCESRIQTIISQANKSIIFAANHFTSKNIYKILLKKNAFSFEYREFRFNIVSKLNNTSEIVLKKVFPMKIILLKILQGPIGRIEGIW